MCPSDALPFAPAAGGARVAVRLTPRASRNAVAGIVRDALGNAAVKVMVTAVPEDGKANAALIKLLARSWGVPKTSIAVVAGATERRKILHVAGDPGALLAMLQRWAQRLDETAS